MTTLSDNFYNIPKIANTTMTTKQLREILLQTDGRLLANGTYWDIVSKKIGPGIYRVSLKETDLS